MDEAAATWGSHIRYELSKVDGKSEKVRSKKREAKLKFLLTGDKRKMYADPAAKFRRR